MKVALIIFHTYSYYYNYKTLQVCSCSSAKNEHISSLHEEEKWKKMSQLKNTYIFSMARQSSHSPSYINEGQIFERYPAKNLLEE